MFWLATRAGKIGPPCLLGISRFGPARKSSLFCHKINRWLTRLVWSRWLDTGQVRLPFMDRDIVTIGLGVTKTQTRKHRPQTPKNSDPLGVLKTQTFWMFRKLRPPEKLRPPGCLENTDHGKTQIPGCLENSDPQKPQTSWGVSKTQTLNSIFFRYRYYWVTLTFDLLYIRARKGGLGDTCAMSRYSLYHWDE